MNTDNYPQLVVALLKAVLVIEAWHVGMAFDIYYKNSSDMKVIRDALQDYGIDFAKYRSITATDR